MHCKTPLPRPPGPPPACHGCSKGPGALAVGRSPADTYGGAAAAAAGAGVAAAVKIGLGGARPGPVGQAGWRACGARGTVPPSGQGLVTRQERRCPAHACCREGSQHHHRLESTREAAAQGAGQEEPAREAEGNMRLSVARLPDTRRPPATHMCACKCRSATCCCDRCAVSWGGRRTTLAREGPLLTDGHNCARLVVHCSLCAQRYGSIALLACLACGDNGCPMWHGTARAQRSCVHPSEFHLGHLCGIGDPVAALRYGDVPLPRDTGRACCVLCKASALCLRGQRQGLMYAEDTYEHAIGAADSSGSTTTV